MANPEHLAKLKEGVEAWNLWRKENPEVKPDLSGADLRGVNLSNANLSKADLKKTNLQGVNLRGATLEGADLAWANLGKANLRKAVLYEADSFTANFAEANLKGANLIYAVLMMADFHKADLSLAQLDGAELIGANLNEAILNRANIRWADLLDATLVGADLREADISGASLINTNLERANLTACSVHGISVWNVRLEGAVQSNLVITPENESPIQVDNLELAQFIYLLLNNEKIRSVIDTITSKVVLILGRFTPDRKAVLDAIRDELRKRDYLPVLFDFEKPASKDLTGTISTLANMARFIIADLTDPNSVPHELATVIPATVVPVQAIILEGRRPYPMFVDFRKRYHWVLEPHQYKSEELLLAQLGERVIVPAEAKAEELRKK